MEETGGEPYVIMYDEENDNYLYCDCSKESPIHRRSLCYDNEALDSRKTNNLQTLGDFDLKSSSWLLTESKMRLLGGAIFGDKRYNRTFIYHNGAESYYSNRGFRGILKI